MALDVFGLPPRVTADVQIFLNSGSAAAYQIWNKPKGDSMVFMLCISGGGGGGGAFQRAAGGAGGGGGGGACSGIARFICPALFLPDIMYVQVGAGGIGGVGGSVATAGANGVNSFI